ncbi:unnamed protein product [Cylicocyclus nassatus]|uniref:Uncharacterized protein n=1 Tax=Cylicocyclus nassatus TaxID=53992 RepID=A0AA36GVY0_CYLNA|nr:unnamed protein product [Cylicocyclus nassatus]
MAMPASATPPPRMRFKDAEYLLERGPRKNERCRATTKSKRACFSFLGQPSGITLNFLPAKQLLLSQWALLICGSLIRAISGQDPALAACAPTITVLFANMVWICADDASENTPRISVSRSSTSLVGITTSTSNLLVLMFSNFE